MSEQQLALDLDPDAWIREALDDLLVPSAPVEPDSPSRKAEIAAEVDAKQEKLARVREYEMSRRKGFGFQWWEYPTVV